MIQDEMVVTLIISHCLTRDTMFFSLPLSCRLIMRILESNKALVIGASAFYAT